MSLLKVNHVLVGSSTVLKVLNKFQVEGTMQ